MEPLKKLLPTIFGEHLNKLSDPPLKYIFYRIVDVDPSMEKYTLQCVNTQTVFYVNLSHIITDENILYRLHPVQTCYVGVEYANRLKKEIPIPAPIRPGMDRPLSKFRGIYRLCYQDRKGNLCFLNDKTKEEHIMDPCDMVSSDILIEGFNTVQAFHIGLLAGLKADNIKGKNQPPVHGQLPRSHLWLVK